MRTTGFLYLAAIRKDLLPNYITPPDVLIYFTKRVWGIMYMFCHNFKDRKISALGFGCMRLPKDADGKIDFAESEKLIDYALSRGVNYFDTAYVYNDGDSERFCGYALSKYDRKSYNIATKLNILKVKCREDMDRIFEEELQRLKTDRIDFYLLHALGRERFEKFLELDVFEFLQRRKNAGEIGHIGFSFHDTPEALRVIADSYDWEFAQLQLNYLDWERQRAKDQYEILEKRGIPCIVMEPVRGGRLASLGEEADGILKTAAPGRSVASWAIRYAASLPNILTVLSGMSDMDMTKDNIDTMADFSPLSQTERETLAKAVEAFLKNTTVPCTGCRYCMPCPFGVDIPGMFGLYNKLAVDKFKEAFKKEYEKVPDTSRADRCAACGQCKTLCPQHIDIPDWMEKVAAV
jgi:predicted aldo/keto reductase-like oxidoreductase